MSILYLHVGLAKTGTSWVQAALRENTVALARDGLGYPILHGVGNEQGAEIGMGNGAMLATCPLEWLEAILCEVIDHADYPRGVVFSSEEFFRQLTEHDDPGLLPRAALGAGFRRVDILLFIRNPVSHAASLWQQYLKRGGGTAPIEAFFEKYSAPERVAVFLDRFISMNGVRLTCLNYGRYRHDLLSPLCAWLDLTETGLNPPRSPVINRSMTRAELALQLALNRRIGRTGWILSDALCAGLPDLPPDEIRPDPVCQRAMCDRLAPALARVNAHLPETEWYRPDIDPAHENGGSATLSFSPEQIELIGATLGSKIRSLIER